VSCAGVIDHIPDRDRRCIFAAVLVGEALGAAALLVVVGAMVDMMGPGIGYYLRTRLYLATGKGQRVKQMAKGRERQ
jgi:hypothetical protein